VATSVPWTLASGADGLRTVCVEVTDILGNVTTAQDSITLDTTPPGGTFVVNGGNARTSSTTVAVSGTLDEIARFKVGDALDCGGVGWLTANGPGTNASGNVTLVGGDGPHIVAVCARDAAGNIGRLQGEVELDRAGPAGAFTLAAGAAHTAG